MSDTPQGGGTGEPPPAPAPIERPPPPSFRPPPPPGPAPSAPLPLGPSGPGRSGPNWWIVISIVVAVVAGVAMIVLFVNIRSSVDDGLDNFGENLAEEQREERDDVEVADCDTDADNFMVANLEVTNHSSGPSTYVIGVVFESSDGREQLATGFASVPELQPDQFTQIDAESQVEPPAPERTFTCRILEVERFAS